MQRRLNEKVIIVYFSGSYLASRPPAPQCPTREVFPPVEVLGRAFVPTKLILFFRLAGMSVLNIWDKTAVDWGRRALDLDEMEIRILGCKNDELK